jgi:type IV secretion system protein VirB11
MRCWRSSLPVERVILLEDTRELQCAAPDTVALRTRPGLVSMADLVRSTLRLRPTGSSWGEFAAARRWTCSRPGIRAILVGSPPSTPTAPPPPSTSGTAHPGSGQHRTARLIADAIDLVVFIEGRGIGRRIGALPPSTDSTGPAATCCALCINEPTEGDSS